MMRTIYTLALAVSLFFVTTAANGQGMAMNTTGVAANASAMLDVSSTTQGVLVPRMTTAQRTAIASPATGLLVYQTDGTVGFWFYNSTSWTSLNSYTNVTTQGNTFNGTGQLIQANSSGLVQTANLGTGTAGITTFLRGDGTWTTPSGLDVQSNISSFPSGFIEPFPNAAIPFTGASSAFSNSFPGYAFIVSTSGTYLFVLQTEFQSSSPTTTSIFSPYIYVNSIQRSFGVGSSTTSFLHQGSLTTGIVLNAGDLVQVYLISSVGFWGGNYTPNNTITIIKL